MRVLDVPFEIRRGALRADVGDYVGSARLLIDLLCRRLGVVDLGAIGMLDVGCGSKLVECFLAHELPVGRYTGVDVDPALIDYLAREVRDPRFSFHHLDACNAMYNPAGAPFDEASRLPEAVGRYGLITLFSVFTHLEPADYVTMLRLLRRHVSPDGILLFSLYVNEPTAGGHGLVDKLRAAMTGKELALSEASLAGPVPDFIDAGGSALRWALYSRAHAFALFEGTGWRVESLNDPEPGIQHYFICRPC